MLMSLRARLQTQEGRRILSAILTGKLIGLFLVFGLMVLAAGVLGGGARAQDAPVPAPYVNPLNTVWTLVAAFLVFGMQAGFTMLEVGLVRSRESVNILMECIVDTCLCGLMFWAFGFAFMFGSGSPWIGTEFFFLSNAPATYGATGIPFLAFWLFQFAFADCASTITSGAMAGRTGFVGDILYSIAVSGFIYPIIGHWVWGPDGWLAVMGGASGFAALQWVGVPFRDFAGSTVVHTIGGVIALAGSIVLGPRLGRVFKRDGGGPLPAHDMVIAAVGGLILWFGWYGFNPGSTLSAMDFQGIGRVATNTTLAACAGGLVAMFVIYRKMKVWDCSFTVNGFLAGLVAITAPCYWVVPAGAIVIGGIAGIVVIGAVEFFEFMRLDDPVGAVSVHAICGIWGTLSVGLFAAGRYGVAGPTGANNSVPVAGLFYGGGTHQLVAQALGSAAVVVTTLAVSYALMRLVNATGTLRVSAKGETEGLDIFEHGAPAYPEYALNTQGLGTMPHPATNPAVQDTPVTSPQPVS